MAKANLSPALHTELSEQLEKQLDEADELDSLRKAVASAFGDELKRIRLAVARTRRQLKGQDLPQREIPGAERAQVKRDPFLQRLMAAARELLEYREEEEERLEEEKTEKAPKKGLTAVTLHTAGGKAITATPAQLQAGLDDLERRKGKAGKPEAKRLDWSVIDGRERRAYVEDGSYHLVQNLHGSWLAEWQPEKGRKKEIGLVESEQAAAELAGRHHLEHGADALLKNAGAGELTKADTKGPAVARKGGRRG